MKEGKKERGVRAALEMKDHYGSSCELGARVFAQCVYKFYNNSTLQCGFVNASSRCAHDGNAGSPGDPISAHESHETQRTMAKT